MIVSLKFSNFKSYRDSAEFSFMALDDDFNADSVTTVTLEDGSSIRLLNAAVIFGANASGKSNVILALDTLVATVKDSLKYTGSSHPYFIFPYAFDRSFLNKPTTIEIDFIYGERRFVYYIAGKNDTIQREFLKEIRDNGNRIVFERNADCKIKTGRGWPTDKNIVDDSKLLPNQLMLSWIATKSLDGLQDVANYIANLTIYWGSAHSGASPEDRQLVMETIVKDTDSVIFKKLGFLLRLADLGIAKIDAYRNEDKDFKLPDSIDPREKRRLIYRNRWRLALGHTTANPKEICLLDFGAESEGTKALFGVGARLLAALETGAFVAYDEINDAIHPSLLRFLVSLFQSKLTNPKGAQLLFSTHDSSVADYNTLRADQVWFVEKNNAVSDLYSAQDFSDIGIQVPFESWYRAGRFGALPSIGDLNDLFQD